MKYDYIYDLESDEDFEYNEDKERDIEGAYFFPIPTWLSFGLCGDFEKEKAHAEKLWEELKDRLSDDGFDEWDLINRSANDEDSTVPRLMCKILDMVACDEAAKKEAFKMLEPFREPF